MLARVGQQIHQDLAQLRQVSVHRERLIRKFQVPVVIRRNDLLITDRLDHELRQVNLAEFQGLPLVEPGKQE